MTTTRYSETLLPTSHGTFRCIVYRDDKLGTEHVAMVSGIVDGETDVLVRAHSECLTSEVFGSLKCDCKHQLDASLDRIARAGRGVVIYLRGHEGRGIGLGDKIRAYALQEQGHDTVDANRMLDLPDDVRDFSPVGAILSDLNVVSVALLTNNPLKIDALTRLGVKISHRVPHIVKAAAPAMHYLETKGRRMGHVLDGPVSAPHRKSMDLPRAG
jgi:3,4-dihydroxy 2-butanone 4-phosphate synthase / GTP cyclohydrolase II